MNRKHIGLGLVLLTLALAGGAVVMGGSHVSVSRAQIEQGREVYAEYCAACHGPNGEGELPDAPLAPGPDGLYPAPPHDSTGHTWHHSDALIEEIIREGRIDEGFKPMPAFGDRLTDDEIEAVMLYIETWWTREQHEIQATISAQDSEP